MTKAKRIKTHCWLQKREEKHQKPAVYQKGNAKERFRTAFKQSSTAGLAGSNARREGNLCTDIRVKLLHTCKPHIEAGRPSTSVRGGSHR
ncbi:MAG: hypothetical protein DRP50_01900 [Thermotoga sp.]|nr:hypothetical protein [Thermotogota bacterium]RKX55771.1 MAG: hypothetical protein DRP50_01900 [Thermotoga sp.]